MDDVQSEKKIQQSEEKRERKIQNGAKIHVPKEVFEDFMKFLEKKDQDFGMRSTLSMAIKKGIMNPQKWSRLTQASGRMYRTFYLGWVVRQSGYSTYPFYELFEKMATAYGKEVFAKKTFQPERKPDDEWKRELLKRGREEEPSQSPKRQKEMVAELAPEVPLTTAYEGDRFSLTQ